MRKSWIAAAVVGVAVVAAAGYAVLRTQEPASPSHVAAPAGEAAIEPAAGATPVTMAEAEAAPVELYPDDKVLGKADAPITMIEYASLTCPHCAAFHAQVFPTLKSEYIDKGTVRFVYRDYPLDGAALQGSLLAWCAPDDARFFGLVDTMFKLQKQWAVSKDVPASLKQLGALAGLDGAAVDKCFADQELKAKILARTQEAQAKYEVNSTPSFVINGRLHRGVNTIEMLEETFKELLPKG